jgi:hypothetical protein
LQWFSKNGTVENNLVGTVRESSGKPRQRPTTIYNRNIRLVIDFTITTICMSNEEPVAVPVRVGRPEVIVNELWSIVAEGSLAFLVTLGLLVGLVEVVG